MLLLVSRHGNLLSNNMYVVVPGRLHLFRC